MTTAPATALFVAGLRTVASPGRHRWPRGSASRSRVANQLRFARWLNNAAHGAPPAATCAVPTLGRAHHDLEYVDERMTRERLCAAAGGYGLAVTLKRSSARVHGWLRRFPP